MLDNIDTELRKIGLYLINVNISDITDESGYLQALGQEAASKAVNEAKVKVANNDRDGSRGEAVAKAEERKAVADANAKAVTGENEAAVVEANSKAERDVAEAEADRKSTAAQAVASAQAEEEGYAAEKNAETARAERDRATQYANEVVPAEIAKQKVVIDASAAKEAEVLAGQADGEREKAALEGKAEGYRAIVEAVGGNPKDAAMLMIVEQLPAIVEAQAQAISNIEFDKVVVIGGGENGAGGAADFLQSFTRMLPGAHELANAAGLELPGFLGSSQAALGMLESEEAESEADAGESAQVADDAGSDEVENV